MLKTQVTVDLDVLVRSDLIDFLISEAETRKATIVCESPSAFSSLDQGRCCTLIDVQTLHTSLTD